MNQLLAALAATVLPAAACLAIAYPLRPQGGRHTKGLVVTVHPATNPYDPQTRAAFRHFAPLTREAGLTGGAA